MQVTKNNLLRIEIIFIIVNFKVKDRIKLSHVSEGSVCCSEEQLAFKLSDHKNKRSCKSLKVIYPLFYEPIMQKGVFNADSIWSKESKINLLHSNLILP